MFHYTSKSAAESISHSKELWMTYYRNFNDQKEFTHGLEQVISYLQAESEKDNDIKNYYNELLEFLDKEKEKP